MANPRWSQQGRSNLGQFASYGNGQNTSINRKPVPSGQGMISKVSGASNNIKLLTDQAGPNMVWPVQGGRARLEDGHGYGFMGASRAAGKRTHLGFDIHVKPGYEVKSPVSGEIVRQANPYPGYSGVLIKTDDGQFVKIYYISPKDTNSFRPGTRVDAGKTILGTAQDISKKHGANIENHIHIETYTENQDGSKEYRNPALSLLPNP